MKKILCVFLAIAALVLACAKPPVEEMNNAIEALSRAENDVEAALYAGAILSRAREALTKMQEEADSKRYDSAKLYAAEVIELSERAVTEGKATAARTREETANFLDSLRPSLVETEAALNNAKQAPNIELDFPYLEGSLDSAKSGYENAQQSFASNNYQDAIAQGQAVRSTLGNINAMINEAAQARSSKR